MSGNESGESWDWKRSQESGYSYPVTAHLMERNRDGRVAAPWPVRATPTRHPLAPFKAAVAAAALATCGVLTLGVLTTSPGAPNAAATPTTTATAITAPWSGPAFTAPTKTVDPYADTGTWLVGADLPAGVYRVTVTNGIGGYWARCANPACEIGAGLIANDVLNPGDETVLHIHATDHSVRTAGVRLIPA